MIRSIAEYLNQLSSTLGEGWNRFWFTPTKGEDVFRLRFATGLLCILYWWSYLGTIELWHGPSGRFPPKETEQWRTAVSTQLGDSDARSFDFSILNAIQSDFGLELFHWLCLPCFVLFALGKWNWAFGPLSLAAILSFVHRAPRLTTPFETVLCMLVAYLCFTPSGTPAWNDDLASTDDRQSKDRASKIHRDSKAKSVNGAYLRTTVSRRLIQVHVAMLYLAIGLPKLAGAVWWQGEGIWQVLGNRDSAIVDFTFLRAIPRLVELWSHAIVVFELLFPILIWRRVFRPLLLTWSVVHWTLIALASGWIHYSLAMVVAGLVFLGSDGPKKP